MSRYLGNCWMAASEKCCKRKVVSCSVIVSSPIWSSFVHHQRSVSHQLRNTDLAHQYYFVTTNGKHVSWM